MKHANANVKTIERAKKIIVGILVYIFVRVLLFCYWFSDYCDEIISVTDSVSTNVTSTVSKKFPNKKKWDIKWIVIFSKCFC